MKKLIRTLLKEYMSNVKLIEGYVTELANDLKKLVPDVDVEFYNSQDSNFYVSILNFDEDRDSLKINKLLRNWKKNLLDYGIIMGFEQQSKKRYPQSQFLVSFKSINTRRIKPNRFVFHNSSIEPSIILREGLMPISSEKGNWSHHNLAYPPAVFAANTYEDLWGGKYTYVIDTSKISNSWWYDLNEFKVDYMDHSRKSIMTFEPVSPDAIAIIPFDQIKKIIEDSKAGASRKEIESKIESFF